jgi:hypothetical protein
VNLGDFLKRLAERHHEALWVEVTEVVPVAAVPAPPKKRRRYTGRAQPNPGPPSQLRADADRRRQRRAERYDYIRHLHQQGFSIRRIMRKAHVARCTIRRALTTTGCPEHGLHQRRLKPFLPYLTERCQQGERNAHRLYLELQAQGYAGSYNAVVQFFAPYRQTPAPAPAAPPPPAPVDPPAPVTRVVRVTLSTRQVARWLADACPDMTDTDRAHLDQLCQATPDLALARILAADFRQLLLQHQPEQLAAWIERARGSHLPEFDAFAQSLLTGWMRSAWPPNPTGAVVRSKDRSIGSSSSSGRCLDGRSSIFYAGEFCIAPLSRPDPSPKVGESHLFA